VQACELFGHLLTADRLSFAYRSAGRIFQSRLAATFLVLKDGDQPTANFFVPAARVTASVSTPAAVGSAPIADLNVPPPIVLNHLQKVLSAPVPGGSGSGIGSGRKRPAEVTPSISKRFAT
jgi:hypothetical protein